MAGFQISLASHFLQMLVGWRTSILPVSCCYLQFINPSIPKKWKYRDVHNWDGLCRVWVTPQNPFKLKLRNVAVILTLRTWIVWEKDRRLTYGLPILFWAVWITGFIIIGIYLRNARGIFWLQSPTFPRSFTFDTLGQISPFPRLFGCLVRNAGQILSVCYILLMVYDACKSVSQSLQEECLLRASKKSLLHVKNDADMNFQVSWALWLFEDFQFVSEAIQSCLLDNQYLGTNSQVKRGFTIFAGYLWGR